ncbi:hypothetical protein AALP_AA3G009100 [Arabis alpina]|uniref:Amino acid transporter transmembrane domain-containing protein n=1 Tax=Arabis alpina TaxID=50452 RepID=A0A087H686_ARAAL|nr:hypothetical protein AALP_AA3G009100 [Arabis alpina]
MSELGWGPGVVVLILSWAITLYTLWQMIEMHEMFPGKRFDRYHELGQAAFGENVGLYIMVPLQLLVKISACIVYMVTGGQSLKNVHDLAVSAENCTKMKIRHFILIFASSHYSAIAWVASVKKHATDDVDYGYRKRTTSVPLAFLSALGEMAFAYAGHNVVLEIQATIPSTPEKPSKGPMWKGALVAYIIVAFCYFPVAIAGFHTFGNKVEENILESLTKPKALAIVANVFVVLHLLGSYQVYAMPVFDMAESVMIKKWHFRPTKVLRYSIRWTFVAATMSIAVALPYFSALLSFFGGFVFAPTTYFIPCIMWLILKKPKRFSASWCTNWSCIIVGIVLMIIAPIGGLAKLIGHIRKCAMANGVQNQDLGEEDQSFGLEDWLPITASRNANWYYSAFHNVAAIVGAGVLALPYAMSELGWGPGVLVLILSWVITLYTLWQMIEMHEMFEGQRFDRYHELGQEAFGKRLGLYIVVPLQLLVEISVCIVYMVTGGKSLKNVHDLAVGDKTCTKIKVEHFILIFASSQFVLSLLKNFNSISGVSLVAAVMSVSYSTIAWVASVEKHATDDVDYGYRKRTTSVPFAFLSALGEMAFAYAGHNVVLEIQATIPSTPENPSKQPMWKGAIVAYIIVAICYFPVALAGFWTFGNKVEENILESLTKPTPLIIVANMFVVVHLLGSYQVYAMPVFDMIESVMIKKWHFSPTRVLRFTIRWSFVAATMGVAVRLPYFSALLSFFGGFVFAPTTYFIPCIMWLILKKPKRFGASWCINWSCIILGMVLMIIAPIGGLVKLIDHLKKGDLRNIKCITT